MPQYMLLLYAGEEAEADVDARRAEKEEWLALGRELRATGALIDNNPLEPIETATTVRVRDGKAEITDGPFAITKEYLAGYYLLDCPDLDEALRQAARMPLARYGSVEVRPIGPVRAWTVEPG
jgi:hypothetical protein